MTSAFNTPFNWNGQALAPPPAPSMGGGNMGGSFGSLGRSPSLGIPGSGTGAAGQGGQSTNQSTQGSQQQSGQYFQNPGMVNQISGAMANPISQAAGGYMDFINNPTAHPYFQNALQGLLGALAPGENASRLNLMDMFRSAGNTASSTFADKAIGLEGEFQRNRGQIGANVLGQMFPQISQAMFNPMSQSADLMNALKMSQSSGGSYGQSSSQSTSPTPAGGASSMQGQPVVGAGTHSFGIQRIL